MIHKLNIVQQSQEFKQYSRLSLRKQFSIWIYEVIKLQAIKTQVQCLVPGYRTLIHAPSDDDLLMNIYRVSPLFNIDFHDLKLRKSITYRH